MSLSKSPPIVACSTLEQWFLMSDSKKYWARRYRITAALTCGSLLLLLLVFFVAVLATAGGQGGVIVLAGLPLFIAFLVTVVGWPTNIQAHMG